MTTRKKAQSQPLVLYTLPDSACPGGGSQVGANSTEAVTASCSSHTIWQRGVSSSALELSFGSLLPLPPSMYSFILQGPVAKPVPGFGSLLFVFEGWQPVFQVPFKAQRYDRTVREKNPQTSAMGVDSSGKDTGK